MVEFLVGVWLSFESENIGEWLDNLFSRVPDTTMFSMSVVKMLSMQVLRQFGCSCVAIEISGDKPCERNICSYWEAFLSSLFNKSRLKSPIM